MKAGKIPLIALLCGLIVSIISCNKTPPKPTAQDYTDFLKAVMNDDVTTATSLLAKGLDIKPFNTTRIEGVTVMNLVSSADMARLLVDNGVSPELTDSKGYTLLMIAASQGKADLVHYLIESKVDLAATTDYLNGHTTALDMAAMEGRTEIVRMLMKAGANIGGGGMNSALGYAITQKHPDTVKFLLAAGATVGWNEVRLARDSGSGNQIQQAVYSACLIHHYPFECPTK